MNTNETPTETHDSSLMTHHCASDCASERRPGRPLKRLLDLTDAQMARVETWLKERLPGRKILELCRTELQKEIPYMTIVRYANRVDRYNELQHAAQNKQAAAELSRYAVTGHASFTAKTLELLEQDASDLALAYHRDSDAGDLRTLKDLWALIHKAKNTAIRDRHAANQEDRRALNREKFTHKIAIDQFKAELATARLDLAQKTFHLRAKLTHHRLSVAADVRRLTPNTNVAAEVTRLTSSSRNAIDETHATPADQNNTAHVARASAACAALAHKSSPVLASGSGTVSVPVRENETHATEADRNHNHNAASSPHDPRIVGDDVRSPLPETQHSKLSTQHLESGQGEGFNPQSNDAHPADQNVPEKTPNNPEQENPSSENTKLGPNTFVLSPEFLARSRQHTHDLITGKIKPQFIPPEIPCPDPDPLWDWLIDDYVPPPDVE
ncbi:MAG TPA: hypothetical protein VF773_08170 [Verrucomicrobiae bacterium]